MADAMDSRLQEIERSVGTLEGQLRGQIAIVEKAKRRTLVAGIIVIVVMLTYLTILTNKLSDFANAEFAAGQVKMMANTYAQDQIPQIAQTLKDSAPQLITNLREQAMKGVPELRKYAEEKTLDLMDTFTAKLETKVDDMVSEMIKAHKGELQPLMEAAAAKGNAEALEKDFQDSLEELLGPEMDKVFAEFDKDMDAIQRTLAYYSQPDNKLTSAELANKYLIVAVLGFINETVAPKQGATPPAKM